MIQEILKFSTIFPKYSSLYEIEIYGLPKQKKVNLKGLEALNTFSS